MFNYSDDIKILGYQLDKYLGPGCWPWSKIANIINMSTSTVRKYYNEKTWQTSSQDEYEIITNKLNSFNFNTNPYELQLLTPQTKKFFLYKDGTVRVEEPKAPISQAESVAMAYKTLPTKYSLTTDIKWPDSSGVYLLCQIVCPPNNPNEKYYLVKVGKSTHLHKRISAYKGMNPFAACIDVQKCPPSQIDATETRYHNIMDKRFLRQANTEWFIVPEFEYIRFLKNGFAAF